TNGGKDFADFTEEKLLVNLGRKPLYIGHAEELQYAGSAGQRLQAGTLLETSHAGGKLQPAVVGNDFAVEEIARGPRQKGTLIFLLNLRPRSFHNAPVFHARWARDLAGQAAQAAVNVRGKRFTQSHLAFVHVQHLVNTSARRVHFHAQNLVGRAMVQAQPAMDTGPQQLPSRHVG